MFLLKILLPLSLISALIWVNLSSFSPSKPQSQVLALENSPFVKTQGTNLYLNGQFYRFTGINAYQLATVWGVNAGCGTQVDDLDGFFGSLRPNSMVRVWAFQGSNLTNLQTGKIDFGPLDRVVNAASIRGQKLIIGLSGQSGTCDDGHWKDRAWYLGGFKQAFDDNHSGLTPLPYFDYIKQVVTRYKDSPTIAMWEPVSEPEGGDCEAGFKTDQCYSHMICDQTAGSQALRSFFDVVGGQIKALDPNHLVESGFLGGSQCGVNDTNYLYIHQSPGIDVASYHDYGQDTKPMPGDQWTGLGQRLAQMKSINKPLIVGEAGISAGTATGCYSTTNRRDLIKAKLDAQFASGIAGFMPWSWKLGVSGNCEYDILQNDPVMSLIHDYPIEMGTFTPPTPTPLIIPISTPQPEAGNKLGGLDLGGYCSSLGQASPVLVNGNWNCGTTGSKINLSEICVWQYLSASAFAKQDIADSPYSWVCYLPAVPPSTPIPQLTPFPKPTAIPTPIPTFKPTPVPSQKLGGLDLSGFCGNMKQPAATYVTGNWTCGPNGQNINLTESCQWQYNSPFAFAQQLSQGNQYSWICFK